MAAISKQINKLCFPHIIIHGWHVKKKENGYYEQGDIKFLMDREVGVSVVKNPPAMQEMRVQSLGWEDPPEKDHSSILAWRILWTEESGGLPSMGLQRVGKLDLT